jgi:hypothetical protein
MSVETGTLTPDAVRSMFDRTLPPKVLRTFGGKELTA